MTNRHAIVLGTVTLLLAACSGAPEDRAETPTEAEETPDPEATVSILRPEVKEPKQEAVLLEPLNVVIGFPDGGAELDDAAKAALTLVLETEQLATGAPIVLRGHSDAGGTDAANEKASRDRAEAVRDWLSDNGVAEDRMSIIAFGEQNPVEPNALPNGEPNEEGRAANRRVELLVVPPAGTVQKRPTPEGADEASSGAVGD